MLISPYLNRYVNRYAKYIDMQLFLDCNIGGQKDTFFILKKKVDVKKKKKIHFLHYIERKNLLRNVYCHKNLFKNWILY